MSDTTMTKISVFSLIICVPLIIYLVALIHALKTYPILCIMGQPAAFAPLLFITVISVIVCKIINVMFFS